MEIKTTKKNPGSYDADIVVYLVRQPDEKQSFKPVENIVDEVLKSSYLYGDFKGKADEILSFYPVNQKDAEGYKAKRVLVVGLGKDDLGRELFRLCGGNIAKYLTKVKVENALVVVPNDLEFSTKELSECLVEGIVLGMYKFNKYKTKEESEPEVALEKLVLQGDNTNALSKGGRLGKIAADAACVARDMANEPGNHWTPSHFASYSLTISKKYGFKRKVLGIKDLERLKMGGLLGVNKGTSEPPKMILLEYRTGKKVPTLMIVGKGLTFDSGGISLKPSAGMEDMKYDMCGGAAVMATMEAVGQLSPNNLDIVAIVPATDNMPGPGALKPGDIVRHYNGKTVEIISTDAEGRLILADALSYGIKRYKPDAVIDLATLTGAVIIGLGHHKAGLMSNNDKLADNLIKAGESSGEPLWRLPLGKEYSKQLESKVADLKNLGGKGGGTITAGAFLQEFVGDTNWAHLDIAGTAWNFTEKSYIPKGPSGTGVRTLIELIKNWK